MDVPYSEHEGTELPNMDLDLHLNLYVEPSVEHEHHICLTFPPFISVC